jgi:crotonobetainyl-CoA:carnitine CoA-transferase CaiB-like acyl-CoA transferase
MFEGLKVLELASVLAGPSVGQFFAELGAEVIKVENLKTGGDVTRTWKGSGELTDDRSAYFCSVNWGKKSIAVDLTSSEGKSIVQKLAEKIRYRHCKLQARGCSKVGCVIRSAEAT